jgi:hypothetical protein
VHGFGRGSENGWLAGFRLAGVALVVPMVNYWWPLPANVSRSAFEKLDVRDRRAFWIVHHMPSLFYAWITQKWFRMSPIVRGERDAWTEKDWEIITENGRKFLESGLDPVRNFSFPCTRRT